MMLARKRLEVAAKVHQGLRAISTACFPYGEPSVALMEALISDDEPYGFVEDELLDILFNSKSQYNFEKYLNAQILFYLIQLYSQFQRHEGLTAKLYGAKVFRYLRMKRSGAQWKEFFLLDGSDTLEYLLQGTVMMSQCLNGDKWSRS